MVRRLLLSILVLGPVALAAFGCGSSGGDDTRGARRGAYVFVLPAVPASAGETVVLGFKNATTTAAPVYITPYMPSGAMYAGGTTAVTVPGRGELRTTLAGLLGEAAAGGWVHIDTRDVAGAPDAVTGEPVPLATSGYVFPYIEREVLGGSAEQSVIAGLVPRGEEVRVCVGATTLSVQLVNTSILQMPAGAVPLPVSFDVDVVGADGSTISSSVVGPVLGNASVALPFTPPFGAVGFVRARPVAPPAAGEVHRFAMSSRESSLQTFAEGRYHEASDDVFPGQRDLGFDMEFGADTGGSVHDFGVMLCNATDAARTVTLKAVYRRGGLPILTSNRLFTLRAGRTVFFGTTDSVSYGLEGGEVSWFSDLFGDVFAYGGFEAVTLYVQAPREVDVSARHFDAAFGSFYRVLAPIGRTNRACVYDMPVASSTSSGRRSWITITNTTAGELRVPVRAFTPMLGTEYLLSDIVVPAGARFDWSPDGIQLREEPTATVGPFVPRLVVELSPTVGALFRGRVEARDAGGALVWIRPAPTRSN